MLQIVATLMIITYDTSYDTFIVQASLMVIIIC